jgi:hypothetical protein
MYQYCVGRIVHDAKKLGKIDLMDLAKGTTTRLQNRGGMTARKQLATVDTRDKLCSKRILPTV